jgi:phosphohistidine phosphatase
LNGQSDTPALMIVGHFPFLPRLLAHLLTSRPDAAPVAFPMNGLVALEEVDGGWVERWRLGEGEGA